MDNCSVVIQNPTNIQRVQLSYVSFPLQDLRTAPETSLADSSVYRQIAIIVTVWCFLGESVEECQDSAVVLNN